MWMINNSLLDRADDSKTKSILRAANSLKSNARANEKTLEKAGITVDAARQTFRGREEL